MCVCAYVCVFTRAITVSYVGGLELSIAHPLQGSTNSQHLPCALLIPRHRLLPCVEGYPTVVTASSNYFYAGTEDLLMLRVVSRPSCLPSFFSCGPPRHTK